MLTHFKNLYQSVPDWQGCVCRWKKLSGLMTALCLAVPGSGLAQPGPALPRAEMSQSIPGQIPSVQGSMSRGMIQQVQNTPQSARAIHHLIADMPESQEELEIIQQRSQLIVTRSNLVRVAIADPTILEFVQYSPKEFAIVGLGMGTTTLTMWFENQPEPLIYTVKTIRDPNLDYQRKLDYGKLEKRLAVLYPNSKVYLIPMSRKILVRGQARDSNEAAHILATIRGEIINQEGSLFGPQGVVGSAVNPNGFAGGFIGGVPGGYGGVGGFNGLNAFDLAAGFIINELQVPGEFQISLRVRIAELSRTAAENAGVNINVLLNNGRQAFGSAIGGATGGLSGTFENGEVGLFLDWLSSNGTAKILAQPTATVLSGRNVRFLSGGEFAVPTIVGVGGAQGTSTTFRGFGTSLLATPTVIDRDNIRISVVAEYSNVVNQNTVGGIPGMTTRRIETVVELREGQTMGLGGLLSNRTTVQVQRFPLLGDIPHIGPLFFSAKTLTQEENELLILITPQIVRPIDDHEVPPPPGFDVPRPSHEEFWKYNMTEGRPDTGYYHSAPYGSGTTGINVDYQHFNPGPAASMYSPIPTNPGPGPTPLQGQFNGSMPMNGTSQNRQLTPVPQAAAQRRFPTGQSRPMQSQVIPTGGQELRQTNYSAPLGLSPVRRTYRGTNNSMQQQQQ